MKICLLFPYMACYKIIQVECILEYQPYLAIKYNLFFQKNQNPKLKLINYFIPQALFYSYHVIITEYSLILGLDEQIHFSIILRELMLIS